VNAVLAARVGEALRVGIVRRRVPGATVSALAGTIVLATAPEVAFEVGVIGAVPVAGRCAGRVASPLAISRFHPVVLVGVGCGALLLGLLGWLWRGRLAGLASSLAHGRSGLRSPGRLLRGVIAWKLVARALRFAAAVDCFLLAFHLKSGLWVVPLVIVAPNLARLLPLAPGSAGTQQAALALAGSVGAATVPGFGVGRQAATGLADVVVGAVAIALVSSWSDVGKALRPSRHRLAPAS